MNTSNRNDFLISDLVSKEPISQFKDWYEKAMSTEKDADVMTMATSTRDGRPSVRIMHMLEYDNNGFKFNTNSLSRKATEFGENPQVALVFYWEEQYRSVQIEGHVEKLSATVCDKFFEALTWKEQVETWVRTESSPATVKNRQGMMARLAELKEKMKNVKVSLPPHWAIYRVVPEVVQFWHGNSIKLHDRIVFRRPRKGESADGEFVHQGEDGWVYERITPW